MKTNEKALDLFLKNLRFTNEVVLKSQIERDFMPMAHALELSQEEIKYFVKRFFRKLNNQQANHPFTKFLQKDEIVNYKKIEYDWDSWAEWLLIKTDSIEKAASLLSSYDPDWVGEIEIQLRDYDCTGQTFSSGMRFTQINENLVLAYKRYDLDV